MIELFVSGTPAPGGSKTAFQHKSTGRIIVMDACRRNKGWRATIAAEARRLYQGEPLTGPLFLNLTFLMPRPKSHYKSSRPDRDLKATSPLSHTQKPDATKLCRAVEDALTGITWIDDSQITTQSVQKRWAASDEKPGVEIRIGHTIYE